MYDERFAPTYGAVAGRRARSVSYYRQRWDETHILRARLAAALRTLGWEVLPGCANFLLCHLPASQPEASVLVAECRRRKLFLRDVANMGECFDARTVRVAVKDAKTNTAILNILKVTLAENRKRDEARGSGLKSRLLAVKNSGPRRALEHVRQVVDVVIRYFLVGQCQVIVGVHQTGKRLHPVTIREMAAVTDRRGCGPLRT